MSSPVHLVRQGAIALITVDHPPVNALGQAVRAALLEAFQAVEADDGVQAVVLICNGNTFIAGADIKEFGQPPRAPLLPEVVEAIEAGRKPSVAAIHGSALGGGLEVAMACHYRIARCDARLGLPEVKLGLLPGAGGTQRLPRLVGVARALRMIVGGTPIAAAEAEACGLLDELFEGESQAAGLAFALRLLAERRGPRRTGERNEKLLASDCAELFAAKRREVEETQPNPFSPLRAIAAIEAATLLPLAEGLRRERALFEECLQSPQREALVAAFFAERQARRQNAAC
ncbi:3-hydroxyacyl-CoA dehydrogenase [Azotobacter beijerinckii]|uniref:3-hydroxyacyl-CoA dehydrogenase n=1 Tax=Azotobacter beijerinckii TaxID=170623 RepID=A0A1I3ZH03_9GAMM|nr:enoyl-CoA hydratase-related protein [Azotobacter beijerinckii]SFB32481.1 3-hydroxyacyl-CoA dehydrogenase [Azotobacter beijerinckii]SFK43272.1 3-hydroxyacyl-CoA dehydrogenase [Azotobacter beijerinckii]